ncbi:MAG: hypothetical protein ABSE22_05595 [Xanthobacteraceae bacterium]|jgi:hypothetical protein
MTIITKCSLISVLALLTAAPVAAQQADWSQKGDYYAPSPTVVQQPTAAELNRAKEGDYYAPTKTIVQQPTAAELRQDKEGDYYAPQKGE